MLYYHSVAPHLPYSHSPEEFTKQLKWLRDRGYVGLRLDELPAVLHQPDFGQKRFVVITFDDGYADNVDIVLPILLSCGFKATFFIVAGMIFENTRSNSNDGFMLYPGRAMMNYADIRKLANYGMEIGSHGWSHRQAVQLAKTVDEELTDELTRSKAVLAEIIGRPLTSFSYPNGQRGAFSEGTRAHVSAVGYASAVTTMWAPLKSSDDLLALPRCEVMADDSLEEFEAKMTGRREYLGMVARMMQRSKIWDHGGLGHQ
jgi:peptidoglycan/xylan/chitin deacetylase (PgdA/CDA1 family)